MENQLKMDTYTACSIIEEFCGFAPTEEQQADAWAHLIKTGDCWRLQGFYGRGASNLIERGIISSDGEILVNIDEYEG